MAASFGKAGAFRQAGAEPHRGCGRAESCLLLLRRTAPLNRVGVQPSRFVLPPEARFCRAFALRGALKLWPWRRRAPHRPHAAGASDRLPEPSASTRDGRGSQGIIRLHGNSDASRKGPEDWPSTCHAAEGGRVESMRRSRLGCDDSEDANQVSKRQRRCARKQREAIRHHTENDASAPFFTTPLDRAGRSSGRTLSRDQPPTGAG